ncbi:MAG: rhodanese-like domain-containing protein [bacterium]
MTDNLVRVAMSVLLALAGAAGAVPALGQGAKPGVFADEDKDWGVPPTRVLRTVGYHSPTPLLILGGKTVTTGELGAMLEGNPRPYVIDVLGGGVHRTIAGAFWMIGAGAGDMSKDEESRFAKAIAAFAGGDKGRALVFFCVDAECWLSYNAALRAIALGYTNVMWYRGGVASWRVAELPMAQSDPFFW